MIVWTYAMQELLTDIQATARCKIPAERDDVGVFNRYSKSYQEDFHRKDTTGSLFPSAGWVGQAFRALGSWRVRKCCVSLWL